MYTENNEEKNAKKTISNKEIPFLWILTPTLSSNKLENFSAQLNENIYGNGVYLFPPSLRSGIVLIHQLPVNQEILWLRMLGTGNVQQKAIEELKNLPSDYPHKDNIIELVLNLLTMLESNQQEGNILQPEDRELVMKLSPVYLERLAEKEQIGIEKGLQQGLQQLQQRIDRDKELIIRLIQRKLGVINEDLQTQVKALNIDDLETLAENLFNMNSIKDLQQWLSKF